MPITVTSGQVAELARTWLFVPGDRPERFQKATDVGPDVVVLDLEDAVAPLSKDTARQNVFGWLSTTEAICAVRINAVGTRWHDDDMRAISKLPSERLPILMLPKTEDPQQVGDVTTRISERLAVIALIETAVGVVGAVDIAKVSGVERLALGSYDLAAQLGVDPDYGPAMAAIRSHMVLASAIGGLAGPIDGVTGDVSDLEKLENDVTMSAGLGFAGKLCIHPVQVGVVAGALSPSEADVAWAHRILAASTKSTEAVLIVDGKMVDSPVVSRARRILAAIRTGNGE